MEIIKSPLIEIALRTAIVYAVVLIGLRLLGKREVGQMMPLDFVMLLLLANAVQNAMTGPDSSLAGGLIAAITLLVLNLFLTHGLWRHDKIRHFVEGTPTLLIRAGKIIHKNLAKEKITEDDLHQALREYGIASVAEVGLAVLEVDGMISVLKNEEMPTNSRPHHRMKFLNRK